MQPRGLVLYRGPSLIDGKPIVAIANGFTGTRTNRKTGRAIQTYILRSDMAPTEAAATGQDESICGACPLRPIHSGVCYVELGKGVWWTWQAFQRGIYPAFQVDRHGDLMQGQYARLGTYGDPAAVPFPIWAQLTGGYRGGLLGNWSGYTHQWQDCDQRLRTILMASVDSVEQAEAAQLLGWRTFRMRQASEDIGPGEIVCPSSDEGGNRRQCNVCRACRGNRRHDDPASSVTIQVHGRPWKAAQLNRLSLEMVS